MSNSRDLLYTALIDLSLPNNHVIREALNKIFGGPQSLTYLDEVENSLVPINDYLFWDTKEKVFKEIPWGRGILTSQGERKEENEIRFSNKRIRESLRDDLVYSLESCSEELQRFKTNVFTFLLFSLKDIYIECTSHDDLFFDLSSPILLERGGVISLNGYQEEDALRLFYYFNQEAPSFYVERTRTPYSPRVFFCYDK